MVYVLVCIYCFFVCRLVQLCWVALFPKDKIMLLFHHPTLKFYLLFPVVRYYNILYYFIFSLLFFFFPPLKRYSSRLFQLFCIILLDGWERNLLFCLWTKTISLLSITIILKLLLRLILFYVLFFVFF